MIIRLYNDNPNPRDVRKVVDALSQGAIAIIPTDTLYSFVCSMEFKKSVETIAQLKHHSLKNAHYSLLFHSLSQASEYLRPLDKDSFQLLRSCLPGPYTFILDANNNVPRNYLNPNKTIGIRVPDNNITRTIIQELGTPLIGTSVRMLDQDQDSEYLTDPELIHELFSSRIDLLVDGGFGDDTPSTVIDCSGGQRSLIREGKGPIPDQLAE